MIPIGIAVLAASITLHDVPVARAPILESLDRHAAVGAPSPPPALLGALAGGALAGGIGIGIDAAYARGPRVRFVIRF